MINKLKTRRDLANVLHIPESTLTYVLYKKGVDSFYTQFEIPKKNGDIRVIHAPNEQLKYIQKKLSTLLSRYDKPNKIVHGFKKGKTEVVSFKNNFHNKHKFDIGIITNALKHRNKKTIINIDLKNFFDSFHFGRVRGFFHKNKTFKLPLNLATILAQLTCYEGKLPQGAPTSPVITNLIGQIMDRNIMKVTKKYKLLYTRYADDLTFSTNDSQFKYKQDDFFLDIHKAIEESGFKINPKKTRVQYNNSQQSVTGLTVNKKVNVPRVYYKKTRAMAYSLYKNGYFVIDNKKYFQNHMHKLEGRFSFIQRLVNFNRMITEDKKTILSTREKDYRNFLFFKYFYSNEKPLIVTEGKTDILYLKAALKNMHTQYPHLIQKNENGRFSFFISFLRIDKLINNTNIETLFNIKSNGGAALKAISKLYSTEKKLYDYFLELTKKEATNPVILLYDREFETSKSPINQQLGMKSIKNDRKKDLIVDLKKNLIVDWSNNLFIATLPSPSGCTMENIEIEDLIALSDKAKNDKGKFANMVYKQYKDWNFENFNPLFNALQNTIIHYHKEKTPKN